MVRRVVQMAWWILASLWLSTSAMAQVTLQLDDAELQVGQTRRFHVTLNDVQPLAAPEITAPPEITISLLDQAQQTRTTGGRQIRIIRFTYELTGRAAGTFVVGPALATVTTISGSRQVLRSTSESLTIQPATIPVDTALGVEVDARFASDDVWDGQVVLHEQTIRSRRELRGSRWLNQDTQDLPRPRDGRRGREELELPDATGTIYVDRTWKAFIAPSSGTLTFDAPLAEVELGPDPTSAVGLSRPINTVVQGAPYQLLVRPRPAPPPGFSGLIGDFEVSALVKDGTVAVGESVSWVVEIAGDGTLETFEFPPMTSLEGAQVYQGKWLVTANLRRGRYLGHGRFEHMIVPIRPGQLTIPAVEIITFSPTRGSYVTLRLPPRTLQVVGDGADLDLLSFARDGIQPPDPEEWSVRPLRRTGWDTRWRLEHAALPVGMALAALPALVGGLLGARRRWREHAAGRATADSTQDAPPQLDEPSRMRATLQALQAALNADEVPDARVPEATELARELERVCFAGAPAREGLLHDAQRVLGDDT